MGSSYTRPLSELSTSCVGIAGGKGSSLGELMRAGVSVPPGFVVTSAAYEEFLGSGEHRRYVQDVIASLDAGKLETAEAARQITAHLEDVPVPSAVSADVERAVAELGVERVSVRSSATCEDSGQSAWAGQLETYLNVPPADVAAKVRDCWLSIFRPAALAYGAAHGYGSGQFAVAVVVQQMVNSDVSGIGFSVHPVTQEPDIQLIEACFGLGEAIVSGKIVPDQYVVDRRTGQILERSVGGQTQGLFVAPDDAEAAWRELGERGQAQKLTDEQIRDYGQQLVRIEQHYGRPIDTEWALADGQFQLLQARPITTLAEEYREAIIDETNAWQFLVRRPMSLIEVSIWSHWIDTRHAVKCMGIHADRALAIQDDVGLSNDFLPSPAIEGGLHHVADMFRTDRAQLVEALRHGEVVYRDAQRQIDRGAGAFADLDQAADFFAEVAQYTCVFPAWALIAYDREDLDDPEVRALAESLRNRTLYPSIERRIIDPLVTAAARKVGFSDPEQAPMVTTWSEFHRGTLDRDLLEWRLESVRAGRRFVFQSIDGDDQVHFLSQTGYLLMRLARQRQVVPPDDASELVGQAAWPGVYRGRARLVLAPDAIGQEFEEGEVLVSIQSSPALMPLLERAGAIVTDDGGIACHAAIIARELRKPTLIGTRRATATIHTGDLVEVDTYAQTVRIVERASAH